MTDTEHGAIYVGLGSQVTRLDTLLLWSDLSEIRAYEELDEPLENDEPLSVVVDNAGYAVKVTPELARQIWELAMQYQMETRGEGK